MKIRKIGLALFLVFLTSAPAGSYVYRFTEGGAKNHWEPNKIPITYAINQSGSKNISISEVERVIKLCFQAWEKVPLSKIEFSYQGRTPNDQQAKDGQNLVAFDTYTPSYQVSDKNGPSVVGITISTYYSQTGEIIDADIFFNEQNFTFTTTEKTDLSGKKINLQDVATHEIGHLLGLDHTYIEQATMYPFAMDGQQVLHDDDIAGGASLYPDANFDLETDSLSGTVKDDQGQPILGVFVSAIKKDTGEESVAAISGQDGGYNIKGLRQSTAYYLKARSVDLSHIGYPYKQGNSNVYIPEYYDNASRLLDARSVVTGPAAGLIDFSLQKATILASYDRDKFTGGTTILTTPVPVKDTYYLAVRFPAASLPKGFNVFGMTFFNNDDAVIWPRIMLTSGTDTQPDMNNPLRQFSSYIGQKLSFSTVEWESMVLTNTRTLWVVFQMPNSSTVNVGAGPGIGTMAVSPGHGNLFYSTNNGASFTPHSFSLYDPLVYLTVSLSDGVPVPVIQLAAEKLDFGKAKVNHPTVKPLAITNAGAADLIIKQLINSKPLFFQVSADKDTIPAGESGALLVSFTPADTSLYSGIITVITNDPTRPQIDIAVSGQGAYPVASVAAQALLFGDVRVGSSADRAFFVRNTGPVSLGISSFQVSRDIFKSLQDSAEVAPGDSAALSVRFAPQAAGAITGLLTFVTDDTLHHRFTISLSGTGTGSTVKSCDFSGDGVINILDAIAFLLGVRANPTDLRYDWNGDSKYTLADAVALVLDIKNGTCPKNTGLLASAVIGNEQTLLREITQSDLDYLEITIKAMGLEKDQEAELLAALSGLGGQPAGLPKAFTLSQNRPNPFNPSTAITFTVPEGHETEHVSLKVYDLRGRLVRVLVNDQRGPGEHIVYWDGTEDDSRKAPSGIYIYRLEAPGVVLTRKMVLVK